MHHLPSSRSSETLQPRAMSACKSMEHTLSPVKWCCPCTRRVRCVTCDLQVHVPRQPLLSPRLAHTSLHHLHARRVGTSASHDCNATTRTGHADGGAHGTADGGRWISLAFSAFQPQTAIRKLSSEYVPGSPTASTRGSEITPEGGSHCGDKGVSGISCDRWARCRLAHQVANK